ncbi:MAG: hypothetical protein WCF84_07085 [Anaerolineae bacterium]
MTLYLVSAVAALVFSGVLAMAGLGAAFLFVPFFYYLGVPLDPKLDLAFLAHGDLPS